MTVAADLASAHGALRRYFLKIGGLPYVLNQRVADPTGDDSPLSSAATGIIHPATSAEYCVAAWRFSGASGADETDATGNGHTAFDNGTIGAQTGKFPDGARGPFSTSKFFNVTDGAWQNLQEFTVAVWFYVANTSQYRYAKIVGREHADADMSNSWSIMTPNGDGTNNLQANHSIIMATIVATDGTVAGVTDTEVLAVGWHHAVVSVDSGRVLRLWVDRRYVGSSSTIAGKTIRYDTRDLYIGRDYDAIATYQWWNGWVDDLAIYSVAKDASWVSRVYGGGLNCLRVPQGEASTALDLATMRVQASSMTFELDDVDDPDEAGASLFGKLFAPSRWASSTVKRTYLKRTTILGSSAAARQLDADATTIYAVKTDAFDNLPDAGTVYVGQETVTYTGKGTQATTTTDDYPSETLGTLTGCTRGLYPAFPNPRSASPAEETFGTTFEYPRIPEMTDGDMGAHQPVADVPFSFLGRPVGFYVTTYDHATAAWNSVDDARLLWAGRVSDAIAFNPTTGAWTLECTSILDDLERKLCAQLPSAPGLWINLNGSLGRTFINNHFYWDGTDWKHYGYCLVALTAGYYTWDLLQNTIAKKLNATDGWINSTTGATYTFDGQWFVERDGDKTEIRVASQYSYNCAFAIITSLVATLDPATLAYTDPDKAAQGTGQPCHALRALGFSTDKAIDIRIDNAGNGSAVGDDPIMPVYQPLHHDCNGGVLLCEQRGTDFLWTTQGDYESGGAGGSAWACVLAEKAHHRGDERDYVAAYTAQTYAAKTLPLAFARDCVELTLAEQRHQLTLVQRDDFVGGDEVTWQQAWVPKPIDVNGVPIGPIRQLLPELLSTGTEHYNDANWDHCPPALSVGIPSSLVDKESFLRADYQITAAYPESSRRRMTLVHKATSWAELFAREAQTYGYCVVFDLASGQITCKPVFDLDLQDVTVELGESDGRSPDESPTIEMSAATVLNSWTFDVVDAQSGDARQITINDRESIEGLGGLVKSSTIKHPGIRVHKAGGSLATVTQELTLAALSRCDFLRYPLQRLSRSLAPTRLGAVSVGDVVGLTYAVGYQDPQGSGARSVTSARALVLDVAWEYVTGAGMCTLLVLPQLNDVDARPWAPSACVDRSAANGGWASGSKTLTLLANEFGESTDEDDGEAFDVEGYKIQLIPRAPADRTSVTPIACTVAAAGYTAGTRALVIAEDISASFDATGETEYVVACADYAAAVAAQLLRGTWQADRTTHLLNAADKAHPYG